MTISKRYLFIIGIPIIALTVFLLLPQTRFLSKESDGDRERREQVTAWQNADYTTIEHTDIFETAIQEAIRQIKTPYPLSQEQQQALAKAILRFIYAHHDGTWESYRAFRIPVSPKYIRHVRTLAPENPKGALSFAAKILSEEKDFDSHSPLEIFEAVGEFIFNDENFSAEFVIQSSGEYKGMPALCTKCWEAVALKSLRLRMHKTRDVTEGLPSFSGGFVSTNHYITVKHPTVIFSPTPGAVLQSRKSVEFVFFTMLVRTDRADYPVGFVSYWSSAHREWLPHELIIGYHGFAIDYIF